MKFLAFGTNLWRFLTYNTTAAPPHNGVHHDVRYKQSAVIEFLVAEKESVRNNHKCLSNVYGSAVDNRSTICPWTKRVTASKTWKAELHDMCHSGHPVTAVSPEILQCTNAIVCEDRSITPQQLVLSTPNSKRSVHHIIREVGFFKVCARWAPQSLSQT